MATRNLLYQREWKVNDSITILVPTVGEVLDHEDDYYSIVSMLTAMPIDMMVQLDEIGVDFSTINDWDLFLILFSALKETDTSMVFKDLQLSSFAPCVNPQNSLVVLRDTESGIVIDRAIHAQIAAVLRKMHGLEKNRRKPGNEEGKAFMLERAKTKAKRRKNRQEDSQLEQQIVALVNTSEFPYGYEGTRELSIYQFNQSLRQIIHKIDYDNRMHGVYSGTVSVKDLSQDDLNWLNHK